MRFDHIRSIGAGAAADADPRAAPEDVRDQHVFRCPGYVLGTDTPVQRLVATLEGTTGNTGTVEFYAQEEVSTPAQFSGDEPRPPEDRRFYLIAAVNLTVGELSSSPNFITGEGPIYARVTVAPVAASVLKVACAAGA